MGDENFNFGAVGGIECYFFPLFERGGKIKVEKKYQRVALTAAKNFMMKDDRENIYKANFELCFY